MGFSAMNNMSRTEVDTNGRICVEAPDKCSGHAVWWQLRFRMTVIPHGVTEETSTGSPESSGMTENKERDGAQAQKTSPAGNWCFKARTFTGLGTKRTDTQLDTEGII